MEKINWKIIRRLFVLSIIIFFLVKKTNKNIELNDIKRINKIYYSDNFESAKKELIKHLQKYSKSSFGWSYLGTIHLNLNDTVNAKKAYNKGFKLNHKNDKAIVGLGILERMKGNYSKSEEYYENALRINPKNPDIYSSLLVLKIIDGNYKEAVLLGEKARRIELKNKKLSTLGNLAIAYHYNQQFEKRDKIVKELQEFNYKDLEYLNLIINGVIDIKELLK